YYNAQDSKTPPLQMLNRGAMTNLDGFVRKGLASVTQATRSHILRRAFVHADDDVAIPWPGVILIVLARSRWMIRMRMIPPDDLQPLGLRCLVGFQHIFCGHRKAVARRIVAPVN